MFLRLAFAIFSGLPLALHAWAETELIESVEVTTLLDAPDDGTYWMQARAGVIPAKNADAPPRVVITLQKSERAGTHMYHGLAAMWSDDLGKTWSSLDPLKSVDRVARPNGLLEAPVDMTPQFHRSSGKLLATGASLLQNPKTGSDVPRGPSGTAYAVYDPSAQSWSPWRKLELPDDPKFHVARAGCTQRIDLPNGDILLPIYFNRSGPKQVNYVTVVRCSFDGTTLAYKQHGNELTVDVDAKRPRTGLYEPSLTCFEGKYLLTLRADSGAYLAVSDDGFHYSAPKPWRFDDGKLLGSYNTQQHWVTHSDGLFLAYTRRGANNDKVFRHRAPLFIARVDPERLVVLRRTEQELLPNLGKAFGNFGVCHVTADETWVTDCLVKAEPGTPSLYLARIRWSQPNRFVE